MTVPPSPLTLTVSARFDDRAFMEMALLLARRASSWGEIPVGAIVVYHHPESGERSVIGRGFNLREISGDPTAHAEVIALRQASKALGHWRLLDCDLYVTLEPCVMCAGAIVNSRIKRGIYGCPDYKAGGTRSLYQIPEDERLNHRVVVTEGVLSDRCALVLQRFFQARRAQQKRARHRPLSHKSERS